MSLTAATWLSLCSCLAMAQQVRPDSGTPLQQERSLPPLPLPAPDGGPLVERPAPPAAQSLDSSVTVTPVGFRIQGATAVDEFELQPLLAPFTGQPASMARLLQAAQVVREYYRARGYLLTEVYLPQQELPARGAIVTLQVLEARVGRVVVRAADAGVSEAMVRGIVERYLRPGEPLSEYVLEAPVLLLRDLPGIEATAAVQPGAAAGEGDVLVLVRSATSPLGGQVGLDNGGVRGTGQNRGFITTTWANPTGHGDALSLRLQSSSQKGSTLYRLGYDAPLGGTTRLGLSALRTEYVLGGAFAALQASGEATVLGLSLSQPWIRSRASNLLAALSLERKELDDRTQVPATRQNKRVIAWRGTLAGNFMDEVAGLSQTSYALGLTGGRVTLDAASQVADQDPTQGLGVAGGFRKLNLDISRTTFLSPQTRLLATVQGQWAGKNLVSSEKFALGGPGGVRGYPVGEGVGDSGLLVTLEYQRQFGDPQSSTPLVASVFHDWGRITYNQDGAPPALAATSRGRETLRAAGLGLRWGQAGDFQLSLQLAWSLTRAALSEPGRRPRAWASLQKWL